MDDRHVCTQGVKLRMLYALYYMLPGFFSTYFTIIKTSHCFQEQYFFTIKSALKLSCLRSPFMDHSFSPEIILFK